MARTPRIPRALTRGPFTIAEAARWGVSPRQLEGRSWRRVGPGVYVWAELELDEVARLRLVFERLPSGAAFSGSTGAWVLRFEGRLEEPFEVTVPPDAGVSARAGVIVRRARLGREDVVVERGLRVTSPGRTLFDLASALDLTEAVVLADAALHARVVSLKELERRRRRTVGEKGSRRFQAMLEHVEPKSESHMESRLRMLLVRAGLPRPEAQVTLRDRWGLHLGRTDLYYRERRLCLEFDGGVHRESLTEDNRRQNRLVNAGYTLLRFTGSDVWTRPEAVVMEVGRALRGSVGLPADPPNSGVNSGGLPADPPNRAAATG